eukprot:3962533-Prymnesium_polylepis.2
MSNLKLIIGFASVASSGASHAYPAGFPNNWWVLLACCAFYFICSGILQARANPHPPQAIFTRAPGRHPADEAGARRRGLLTKRPQRTTHTARAPLKPLLLAAADGLARPLPLLRPLRAAAAFVRRARVDPARGGQAA